MVLADSFYYQPVQIDTINTRVFSDLLAKEGDANGRGMLVQITENGVVKDTTGISLRLQWSHLSAATSGLDDFEIVDETAGLYKIKYNTAMLIRGSVEAFIRITDGGVYAGSRNITITVERMVGSDEEIASSNEFTALANALILLNTWNNTISGKIIDWEADMEVVKQLYMDALTNAETLYPQQLALLTTGFEDHTATLASMKQGQNAQVPLIIPTYEKSGQTVHPSVVFVSSRWNNYEYWMAHTPYPETNDDYENPSVSVSTDGLNWTTPAGLTNPIDQPTTQELVDLYHMSDTELILVNGVMECWYRFNKNSGTEQIMRKTSTNGVTWSAREVVLDLTGSGNWSLSPTIVYEDGKYKLWFIGSGSKIYYTESATGTLGSWTAVVECSIGWRDTVYTPWHIGILRDGAKFKAIINTTSALGKRCLLLAESLDGIAWTDAHVIMTAPETGWDSKELYRAYPVKINGGMYRLYYSAQTKGGQWFIGLVEGLSLDYLHDAGFVYNAKGQLRLPKISTGEIGYIEEDRIMMGSKGVKAVMIYNPVSGVIQILTEAGADLATLKVKNIETTNLIAPSIKGETIFNGPGGVGQPLIKLLNVGVNDCYITTGSTSHSGRVARTSDKAPALWEFSGAQFMAGVAIGNVEGAMRYDFVNHKHQGYNGTTWIDLY